MRKSLQYFRITWTVFCGIACVLLIALWVRSYWWLDMLQVPVSVRDKATFISCQGTQRVTKLRSSSSVVTLTSQPTSLVAIAKPDNAFGFEAKRFASGFSITVPQWFLTSTIAALAAVPWIRKLKWHFSLRTLLIATTLVAVMLGVVVLAVKK